MGLTDDDVREILRIIDESPLEELRIETEGFSLYVSRERASEVALPTPSADGLVTIEAPMVGTFYRAAAPADCEAMDRLYLKDPGGLLTPDAVRELAPHFLASAGARPAELHSHCTIGLAPFVYVEGLRAGFHV